MPSEYVTLLLLFSQAVPLHHRAFKGRCPRSRRINLSHSGREQQAIELYEYPIKSS